MSMLVMHEFADGCSVRVAVSRQRNRLLADDVATFGVRSPKTAVRGVDDVQQNRGTECDSDCQTTGCRARFDARHFPTAGICHLPVGENAVYCVNTTARLIASVFQQSCCNSANSVFSDAEKLQR